MSLEILSEKKWWKKGKCIWHSISASQYKSLENTEIYVHIVTQWPQLKYALLVFLLIHFEMKCLSNLQKNYQIMCYSKQKVFIHLVELFLIQISLDSSLVNHSWLCTYFVSFLCQLFQKIRFKDVQIQWQQKYGFDDSSYCYKNCTQHGKKSPVGDDEIKIVGNRPEINRNFSPIGRHI